MDTIIGIDFGTTNSELAVYRAGKAEVPASPEGARVLASAQRNGMRKIGFVGNEQFM